MKQTVDIANLQAAFTHLQQAYDELPGDIEESALIVLRWRIKEALRTVQALLNVEEHIDA